MNLFEALRQKRTPRHERDVLKTEKPADDTPGQDVSKLPGGETAERLALLTPRERELFLLLLEGYTLNECAERLSMKYSTANTHMTGIYNKLNVNSRAKLIIGYRDAAAKSE